MITVTELAGTSRVENFRIRYGLEVINLTSDEIVKSGEFDDMIVKSWGFEMDSRGFGRVDLCVEV